MSAVFDVWLWFLGLTVLEGFYVVSAAVGALVFVLRIALMFLGADADTDVDLDGIDTDASFQLLSVQGLSGFFVMFGLVGIALTQAGLGELVSILGSFVAGGLTLLAVAELSRMMLRLQSSGNIDIRQAVGAQGTVYLTVPSDGTGQVQVTLQNRLRTFDAIGKGQVELKTGTRITVVEVSGNTLVVEKV